MAKRTSTTPKKRRELASKICRARKRKKLSQEAVARLTGKSLSYIQKVENRVRGTEKTVAEILQAINAA